MWRRRLIWFSTAGLLVVLDLAVKSWAQRRLAGNESVDLGLIDLRLAFNPGVAFSLGNRLPTEVVLGATGVITAGVLVMLWLASRTGGLALQLPLTLVSAGAMSNLVDRAADGVVTDYLHTGWFPTFNGADVLITGGVGILILTNLRSAAQGPQPATTSAGE